MENYFFESSNSFLWPDEDTDMIVEEKRQKGPQPLNFQRFVTFGLIKILIFCKNQKVIPSLYLKIIHICPKSVTMNIFSIGMDKFYMRCNKNT